MDRDAADATPGSGAVTGRCLCGGVTYSAASPVMAAACHCLDCQKQTGSAFSTIAGVPSSSLRIEGVTSVYITHGANGAVSRHFCRACGSPIYSDVASTPGLAWIKTGTLDGPAPSPQLHLWWTRAQLWQRDLDDGRPHLPENPPPAPPAASHLE